MERFVLTRFVGPVEPVPKLRRILVEPVRCSQGCSGIRILARPLLAQAKMEDGALGDIPDLLDIYAGLMQAVRVGKDVPARASQAVRRMSYLF